MEQTRQLWSGKGAGPKPAWWDKKSLEVGTKTCFGGVVSAKGDERGALLRGKLHPHLLTDYP